MVADRLADSHPIGGARSHGEGAVDIGPGGRLRRGVASQLAGLVRRSVAELEGRIAVRIILRRARVLAPVAARPIGRSTCREGTCPDWQIYVESATLDKTFTRRTYLEQS